MRKKSNLNAATRAVIYARYSSANQRDCSIEQQVAKCRELAARLGLTVIDVYEDRAISGKTDRRPNFQRMMKDADLRQFDVVLAWKSNRMGRNMLQAMTNEERLRDNGIRTVYAEEDFDDTAAGRFALRNMMNVNQFYSENMAEDITRGLMDNAAKCLSNGSLPLGYKPGDDRHVVLDEAEAAIVQEIFTRVSCYEPFIDIARDLNRRGIKTKKGSEWGRSSFHTICRNERYRGIYIYRDVRIEGGMPRIVSDELFYKVQEVLKVKKNPQGRRKRSGYEEYLLTGKLFCGHCGSPMTGIAGTSKTGAMHYYYTCQKRRTDHSCDKKAVRRDQIERAVGVAIQQQLLTDENIQMMADKLMEYNARTETKYRLQGLQDQLNANKTATANILKAIEMGIITDATKARLLELEKEQGQLLVKIDEAKAEMVPISRNDFVKLLYIYKEGEPTDKKYLAALFDNFLVRVDLYDDHLKITFDPTGGRQPIDMPIGAEESPESPGDSSESSDFEASSQDAEKFVLALHNCTKASNLGSRLFCWCVGYGTTRIIKSGKRSFLLDSKEVPWPNEGVGATIGRPPTWRNHALSGKAFFADKRVGASNARPYKSFLTACGEHGLPASLIRYRPPGKAIHIYCGCVQTLHPYKDMLERDGEIYPVRLLHYNIAKLPVTAIIQKASQTKKETT